MFGLRQKLAMGFGGLLLILLLVSALGLQVMRQHRAALDKFLYENWRSVEYGQNMIDTLEHLNDSAKAVAESAGAQTEARVKEQRAVANNALKSFEKNLDNENQNITLSGEDQLAAHLTELWRGSNGYRVTLRQVLDSNAEIAERRDAFAGLSVLSPQVKNAAQAIVRLNLANMTPIDGQAKALADKATQLMFILSAVGIALAVAFTAAVGRSILQPIQTITRSAREIERGNLDLVVQVESRDELRQLAEAFNSMAAKLREYRRTNRAKLVRTQQTTQLAINSLPDAVAILSPDGVIEMANSAAQTLFGIRSDEHVTALRTGWLADLYDRTWKTLLPIEPRGYESALQVLDEGGSERFFLPHAVPILDDGRQLLGVTVVLADVTNLRRLDEMKSGMLAVVSHELKTPLTSIRMGVHLLLEERIGSLTAQQADLLAAVREDSDRLNRIVENLLDMGRIQSGCALMDLTAEPVGQVVAEAAQPLQAAFHDRGVRLVTEVPNELPSVLLDRTRISLVFSNLLTNALRYTAPGGQVRVSASTLGDSVQIVVDDNGTGIPSEHLTKIFTRFFRVPGQNGSTGAGLGLAITKEIVEAHGGQISVESHAGSGTRFSFTLKAAVEPNQRIQHVHPDINTALDSSGVPDEDRTYSARG
jgi:NtrC-family two-component system sensor histidine kinase KinB